MKPEIRDPKRIVSAAVLNALNVFRQFSDDICEEAAQMLGNYTAFAVEHSALEQDLVDVVDLLQAHFGAFRNFDTE